MADLSSAISSIFPTKAGAVAGAGSSFYWITILIIILILLFAGGITIWLVIRNLQYNKKIHIYEWRNGRAEFVGVDRAKEVKYNLQGDTAFHLKKRKKMLPRGDIKVGKNLYLYGIREDGEWINFSLEDMNQQLRIAGVKFIHPDMRAFKTGMGKTMRDAYAKKHTIKDILITAAPYIFIIICAIALYFIADRLVAFLNAMPQVIEKLDLLLGKMDNMCSPPGYTAA